MASPSVTPGGVTEGAPPAGVDPLVRATTPVAGQTHDIVLGGVGFTLYRGNEDTLPSKVYTSEAVDYTYSPIFLDRTSQSGDLGDDTQDFFMSAVQRDWSGGEGRKYMPFRQTVDSYWRGGNIQPTLVPGQVRSGTGLQSTAIPGVTGGQGMNMVWVKGTGQIGGTNDPQDTLCSVHMRATTVVMQYSLDGGSNWIVQTTTGGTTWNDCVDMCLGDDGNVYCLEGSRTATQSMVHLIKAPSLGSAAWTNWTAMAKQANCICYFQGGVYVGDSAGRLCLTVSAGTVTVIKDFGGGVILQLLSTPEGIYVLYLSPQGSYKVFLYSAGNVTEVLNLPRGWRSQYLTESGTYNSRAAGALFALQQDFMAWSEGVLYITGCLPARDTQQSYREEAPFKTVLYYYSAGNSGIIWQAEQTRYPFEHGGSGCCALINDGMVAFTDALNDAVMAYDPRTGGVFCLAQGGNSDGTTLYFPGIATGPQNVPAATASTITTAINSTGGTTLLVNNGGGPNIPPGSIIRNTTTPSKERVLVPGKDNNNGGFSSSPVSIRRGWHGTTALTATLNTTTNAVQANSGAEWAGPVHPVSRMVYDFSQGTLNMVYQKLNYSTANINIRQQNTYWALQLRRDDISGGGNVSFPADYGAGVNSWIQSSAIEFGSSLSKYWRSLQVDFDTTQFVPARSDELAGFVHAWYKLDGMMSTPFDPYYAPNDYVPINTTTATLSVGTSLTTGAAFDITMATTAAIAASGVQAGSIIYGNSGAAGADCCEVQSVSGVTMHCYRRRLMGGAIVPGPSGTDLGNNAVVLIQNPITSGTRYNINATGKQLQYMLKLCCQPTSVTDSVGPISQGPLIRKATVRGVPIQNGFREREYQIAMFNDQPRMSQQVTAQRNVPKESRTPAELRLALDALVRSGAPISVSDGSMTNVLCVIEPDRTKVRELRGGEFIAFVTVREI